MKITKRQLRRIVKEEIAHQRDNLGTNIADVEFPIVVGYEGKSEIAYGQEELDDILDDITDRGVKYSLDSLEDMEPRDRPVGSAIEQFGESIKITRRQLSKLVNESFAATAQEEAEKINAQTGAGLVSDQAFWEKMGIRTGEELARSVLSQTYSDYYKEINGYRPRRWPEERTLDQMSVDEIQKLIDDLDEQGTDEWYEERHQADQELGWEDDMMVAVASQPDKIADEFKEYDDMPSHSGMGRRTEGTAATPLLLRSVIRESLNEALPDHLQKHFRKDGSSVHSAEVKDVTPSGYGPDEEFAEENWVPWLEERGLSVDDLDDLANYVGVPNSSELTAHPPEDGKIGPADIGEWAEDQKAAREILSTRAGSYKGTTLPGGRKI
jgi:hypothetical protein